jgi:hypothetical protein
MYQMFHHVIVMERCNIFVLYFIYFLFNFISKAAESLFIQKDYHFHSANLVNRF